MTRKQELLQLLDNDITYVPLINEMVYLENQLDELRELPKIKVHPEDKTKQKTTPAAKLYKEYLQQYTNIVRILMKATGTDEADEDSPLRRWTNERNNKSSNYMDS